MGMKHRVDKGIYVTYGAITPQLAERTGFSDADADKIKEILLSCSKVTLPLLVLKAACRSKRSFGGNIAANQGNTHLLRCIAV